MFINTLIPLPRESVSNADTIFKNAILVDAEYNEQRIPQTTEPRFTFDIDETYFRETQLNTFLAFITNDAQGMLNTFRYKHPYFNSCTAYRTYFGTGNLCYQRGVLVPIKDSLTDYQFAVEFGILDSNTAIVLNTNLFIDPVVNCAVTYKTITKIADEFKIYDATGTLIPDTNWNLTLTTGIVTFNSPRVLNERFYVKAKFDLEVRFDVDDVQLDLVTIQSNTPYQTQQCEDLFKFSSLKLVEVITGKVTPFQDTIAQSRFINQLSTTFNLGVQPKTSIASLFQTKIDSFDTGFETRISRTNGSRYTSTYSDMTIKEQQGLYLFTFFIVCKGNLLKFKLNDHNLGIKNVRFKEDSLRLSLTKRRPNCGDLFEMSSFSFASSVFL